METSRFGFLVNLLKMSLEHSPVRQVTDGDSRKPVSY